MNILEKIALWADRIEFSSDGATATIVVRLDRFKEVRDVLDNLDITYDADKAGNYFYINCPLTELF